MYTLADLDAIFIEPQAITSLPQPVDTATCSTLQNTVESDEMMTDVLQTNTFDLNNIFDVQNMPDDNFLEVDEIPRDDLLGAEEFDVSKFFNLPDKTENNKDPED